MQISDKLGMQVVQQSKATLEEDNLDKVLEAGKQRLELSPNANNNYSPIHTKQSPINHKHSPTFQNKLTMTISSQ